MTSKYVEDLFKGLVLDPNDKELQIFWAASTAERRASQLANSLYFFSEMGDLGVLLSKAGATVAADIAINACAKHADDRADLIYHAWNFEQEARTAAARVLKTTDTFTDEDWKAIRQELRNLINEQRASDQNFMEIFKTTRNKK